MKQTDSDQQERDNGGKKGKGLIKEHVWMTHGHGQLCGNWLWEREVGWNWNNCNRIPNLELILKYTNFLKIIKKDQIVIIF